MLKQLAQNLIEIYSSGLTAGKNDANFIFE
jgi:hypothetical protein